LVKVAPPIVSSDDDATPGNFRLDATHDHRDGALWQAGELPVCVASVVDRFQPIRNGRARLMAKP
jgi:hypothetical protein